MITTADISRETGLKQRTIQKRIARLRLKVKRAGSVVILSQAQAERIKAMSGKPGPK